MLPWTSKTCRLWPTTLRFATSLLHIYQLGLACLGHFYNLLWLVSFASLQERTKNAQFIIISLRNNMFEVRQGLVHILQKQNRFVRQSCP